MPLLIAEYKVLYISLKEHSQALPDGGRQRGGHGQAAPGVRSPLAAGRVQSWWGAQRGPGGSPHLKAAAGSPPAFPSLPQAEQTHKRGSFSWLVGRSSLRETLWMGIYSMSQELQSFRGGQRSPQAVTILKTPQL